MPQDPTLGGGPIRIGGSHLRTPSRAAEIRCVRTLRQGAAYGWVVATVSLVGVAVVLATAFGQRGTGVLALAIAAGAVALAFTLALVIRAAQGEPTFERRLVDGLPPVEPIPWWVHAVVLGQVLVALGLVGVVLWDSSAHVAGLFGFLSVGSAVTQPWTSGGSRAMRRAEAATGGVMVRTRGLRPTLTLLVLRDPAEVRPVVPAPRTTGSVERRAPQGYRRLPGT